MADKSSLGIRRPTVRKPKMPSGTRRRQKVGDRPVTGLANQVEAH